MSKERLYFIGDIRLVGKKNGNICHLFVEKNSYTGDGHNGITVLSYDPSGSSKVLELYAFCPEVDAFHYKAFYTKAEVLKLADDINEYYCCEDLKVKCGAVSLGTADNKHAKRFKVAAGLKFTRGVSTVILHQVGNGIYKFFLEGSYNRLNDVEIPAGEYVLGDFQNKYNVKLIEETVK